MYTVYFTVSGQFKKGIDQFTQYLLHRLAVRNKDNFTILNTEIPPPPPPHSSNTYSVDLCIEENWIFLARQMLYFA